MDKKDLSELGIGFLAGALVGGIIALLYAPQKGSETRGMIKDKAVEVRDNAGRFVGKIAKKVKRNE
jgi:gas vesicle protein